MSSRFARPRPEPRREPRGRKLHLRAFSLIELLVVIAIIVVLLGIVLAVGTALGSGSDASRTRNTLEILETTLSEWEQLANRELTWGVNQQLWNGNGSQRANYDMQEGTFHVFLISDVLRTIGRSTDMQDVLAQINQEDLVAYRASGQAPEWIQESQNFGFAALEPDPNVDQWVSDWSNNRIGDRTILDAWDKPIRIIHPGRNWQNGDPLGGPDEDGTVRTPLENLYGVAVRGRPYFVSSGADGAFGDVNASPDSALFAATRDNLYSYEVIKP